MSYIINDMPWVSGYISQFSFYYDFPALVIVFICGYIFRVTMQIFYDFRPEDGRDWRWSFANFIFACVMLIWLASLILDLFRGQFYTPFMLHTIALSGLGFFNKESISAIIKIYKAVKK